MESVENGYKQGAGCRSTNGCYSNLNKLFNKNVLLSRACFLGPVELMVVKPAVVARLVQQLGVGDDFLDQAIIHHDALLGRQTRREPMGNSDHSASGSDF